MKRQDFKNKKIIALYFYSLLRSGGAERMICALANSLSSRGYLVYLITLDKPHEKSFFKLNSLVNWIKIDFKVGFFDKLRRTLRLFLIFKRCDVEAVIGFLVSGDATVLTASKLANIRIIVAERNAPSMYHLRYSKVRRSLNFLYLFIFADYITVQQSNFRAGYPEFLRGRIKVIPNIVERPTIICTPELKNEFNRFILLYIGRLDNKQKQIDVLIKAFSKICNKHLDWDLYIIGDGPDKDSLQQLIFDNNLKSRALIFPSSKDVCSMYSKANLFAMPSMWEGFPNALAEALSHGVPAVGFSQAMGVAELIGDFGGWLADGLIDIDTFANSLSQAMYDNCGRKSKGLEAKIKMEKYQNIDTITMWEKVLRC